MQKTYKIKYTYASRKDIIEKRQYILTTFKYHQYAENFMNKIKKATNNLKNFPKKNVITNFQYRGREIYLKVFQSYLIFYVIDKEEAVITILRVLQERQNWKNILEQWIRNDSFILF